MADATLADKIRNAVMPSLRKTLADVPANTVDDKRATKIDAAESQALKGYKMGGLVKGHRHGHKPMKGGRG